MKFIFQEESPRHKFIGKYILPLFDPAVEYFGQYGIKEVPVVMTICTIICVILQLTVHRKDKFRFKITIAMIITCIFAIIQYQVFDG
jgi:hypothetical protein